ncbi:hypothetical protein J6590_084616, partial [Homalodisca vitripennis]
EFQIYCHEKPVSTSDSDNLKDVITEEMVKSDILKEVQTLRSDMSGYTTSVEFLSAQVDTTNGRLEQLENELDALRKKNSELRAHCTARTGELVDTKERLRNLEQYSKRNNIKISGIPVSQNEDVPKVVKDLGLALGIEVDGS